MAQNKAKLVLFVTLALAACAGDNEKPLSTGTEPTVILDRPIPEGISEEEPGPLDTDADTDEGAADDTDSPPAGTSYATTVAPIINAYCDGCHLNGGVSGGIAYDAGAEAIVDVPSFGLPSMDYIEPGDPEQSYLWRKLQGTQADAGGSGDMMPLAGGPISPTELAVIEALILGGALP